MATEFLTSAKQQIDKLLKSEEKEFTQWGWPGKHWLESIVNESNKNINLSTWNKWLAEIPDDKKQSITSIKEEISKKIEEAQNHFNTQLSAEIKEILQVKIPAVKELKKKETNEEKKEELSEQLADLQNEILKREQVDAQCRAMRFLLQRI